MRRGTRGLIALIAVMTAIAALGVVPSMMRDEEQKNAPAAPLPAATRNVPRAQPPGPVPPGKVWSTEHGHWHNSYASTPDASPVKIEGLPTSLGGKPLTATTSAKTQPPGPAPAGKVWSAEHGHWHNAKTE